MTVRQMPKQAFYLVAGAAFASGALAIALEMILMRLATRYTGSAAYGTTTALTVYLLGLLAGAALVLRLNNKNRDSPSPFPGLMLILLAGMGAGLGYLSKLPANSWGLEQFGSGLPLGSALILVPACLAGTVFPMLLVLCTRFYFGSRESFIAGGGELTSFNNQAILLYLMSNLGSALGAMASAIWLLPRLGISQSFNFIALGWVFAALLLSPLAVATSAGQKEKVETAEKDKIEGEAVDFCDAVVTTSQPFTYLCVFFAALAGLMFECLAIRMLALLCGASFITTACAVTAALLAIALGTRTAFLLPANKNTRLTLALALCLSATGLALTVILLPHLNNVFQAIRQLTLADVAEPSSHLRWLAYFYPRLILALIFCLPGATGLSLIFPLAAKSASRPLDMLRLYIAGGLGTTLAPLVFIAWVGNTLPNIPSSMEMMLRVLVILFLALAVSALTDSRLRGKKAGEAIFTKIFCGGAAVVALAVLFLVKPLDPSKIDMGLPFVSPNLKLSDLEEECRANSRLFYREGRTASISVLTNAQDNTMVLRSDGKVEGTVPINFDAPAVASDLPTQSLLALLPLIWHNQGDPAQSCFLIGYGTGTTAATMVKAAPTLDLRIAEIEPAVVQAGQCFKQNAAIVSPQVITTGDARHILQGSAATFDMIISQPAEPWVQGSTNLYSCEFYKLVKSRLKNSGTFCQWIQLYGIDKNGLVSALATFQATFPHCLLYHPQGAGEVILLGFNSDTAVSDQDVQQNFLLPAKRKLLARAGIDSFEALKQGMLPSNSLRKAVNQTLASGEIPEVTDDNLALELDSVPQIEGAANSIQANLKFLKKWAGSDGRGESWGASNEGSEEATRSAVKLLESGDEKGAVRLVQDYLATDPCCVSALNLQALLALRQSSLQQAQNLISKSLDLNPSGQNVHLLQSLSLLFQGEAARAITEADVAHRLNRLDYRPYVLAAAAFHLTGDGAEATAKLNKARQTCADSVILKQVDGLADEFSLAIPTPESKTYSGTLASRLTRLLWRFSSSSSTPFKVQ